jgi:diaminohydroxyphosphoribosylaminopyrimidine deaminase / 5-amino-6-(5-phosphoribosylamino)uracil reductase
MRRTLELAALADHATSPNPMVGAVVLDAAGEPVGEGFHARAGEPHAERVALERAKDRARGGTLYVNLEPCHHQGRTPPCTEAVIAAAPARVVVAHEDPDARVAGTGLAALKAAGIDVEVGVEREAAERLNRFYLKHRRTGRPWVTLKFAISLDGRIATRGGESKWVTGEAARQEGHRLRQRHDAILVGAGTVLADDPELTNRLPDATRQPLRVVLDSRRGIPGTARVFQDQERSPTLLAAVGGDGRVDLPALLETLGERGILSVLVEGGATVNGAFFDAGLVDGVVAFVAPIVIGGSSALSAVGGEGVARLAEAHRLVNLEVRQVGDDVMVSGDVHRDR